MRRAAVAVLSLSLSIPLRIRPFRSPSHRTAYLARSLASLTHSKNVYAFADTLTLLSLSPFFFQVHFSSSLSWMAVSKSWSSNWNFDRARGSIFESAAQLEFRIV